MREEFLREARLYVFKDISGGCGDVDAMEEDDRMFEELLYHWKGWVH